MYLARFAYQEKHLLTAAFKWPKVTSALLTRTWISALLEQTQFDFAVRIAAESSGCNLLLLVNTDASGETDLRNFCRSLLRDDAPSGVVVPADADEFDTLTAGMPSPQIRVNHQGYHHGDKALACDFRLHPMFESHCGAVSTFYQIHLRPYLPDRETERRVLKYLAWLDIEKPFSEPVRAMQRMLATRMRQRGFLTSEYLATPKEDELVTWREKICTHFDQTTGRIGFPLAPVEMGDFTDLLTTGCHPARCDDVGPELPVLAASVFDEREVSFLFSSDMCRNPNERATRGAVRLRPDIFISYASSDYPYAAAVCRNLEECGMVCWIAPRDIDCGSLPYTEAIQRGISEVQAVIVVLSNAANLSVHIPRELDLALERKLAILPVRLSDIAPTGQLNYFLRTCQWLNAYGRDFQGAMEELVGRLRGIIG